MTMKTDYNHIHLHAFINVFENLVQKYKSNVLCRYQTIESDGASVFHTITYEEVDRIATNLAVRLHIQVKRGSVVALLADHSVNYLLSLLAIMKLRVQVLTLSPRNSVAANVNLLGATGAHLLLASSNYADAAHAATGDLKKEGRTCDVLVIPTMDPAVAVKESVNPLAEQLLNKSFSPADFDTTCIISHSSGSTSFPKPLKLCNRFLICTMQFMQEGQRTFGLSEQCSAEDVALSLAPLFHGYGLFGGFAMCLVGGSSVFFESPAASPKDVLAAMRSQRITVFMALPSVLERLIPCMVEPKDWKPIQGLKYIFYGGAPLAQLSGQWYEDHGANLCSVYGTTETGAIMMSNMNREASSWKVVRPVNAAAPYCQWEPLEDHPGMNQLVIKAGLPLCSGRYANRPDGSFNTSDLFIETPPGSGYYFYRGRQDDILVMKHGEKTNPIPMEGTICHYPIVKNCAVLGSGRQCTIALIEMDPNVAIKHDPEGMIEQVRKAVNAANENAPEHSRISMQMIKILPLNQHLPVTAKGNVIRKRAEAEFKDLIDQAYAKFLGSDRQDSEQRDTTNNWPPKRVQAFLIKAASEVLRRPSAVVSNVNESLFNLGLNSILSIELRDRIVQVFGYLPQDFLYNYKTIKDIQNQIVSKAESATDRVQKSYEATEALVQSYLAKAKNDFEVAKSIAFPDEHVVLLTGATGAIGSHLLNDLLQRPKVQKIYCLVNGKPENCMGRLVEAFKTRMLDVNLLSTGKVVALPMQLQKPNLGLEPEIYDELRSKVTLIQHCGWMLDFNYPIADYDRECIVGLYNLLKFACRPVNPIHFHFISSISAVANQDNTVLEELIPDDVHVAMPVGYGQSKHVGERLIKYLVMEKKFPCVVERVGQVCGDTMYGMWKTAEQYPLLIVSGGSIMHKMPALDTSVCWLPVDYAAKAIVDVMLYTSQEEIHAQNSVYHIVNPRLIPWNDLLQTMKQCGMQFTTVSPGAWLQDLSENHKNPAYRLYSYFEYIFSEEYRMAVCDTTKTARVTPSMTLAPLADQPLFSKFLQHWEQISFYDVSA